MDPSKCYFYNLTLNLTTMYFPYISTGKVTTVALCPHCLEAYGDRKVYHETEDSARTHLLTYRLTRRHSHG